MRNAKRIGVCLAAFIGAAGLYLTLRAAPAETPGGEAAPAAASTAASRGGAAVRRATRTTYALDYRRDLVVSGRAIEPLTIRGTWAVEPVDREAVVEVTLEGAALGGPGVLPEAEALALPFQLRVAGGKLSALAFDPALQAEARDLIATVATAVQLTEGEGASWTAVEEDLNGRYEATYEREPGGGLVRTRRYTALRTPAGWNEKQAAAVRVEGDTRFELDAAGVVRATVAERVTIALDDQRGAAEARIEATLVRDDMRTVAPRPGADLAFGPIALAATPMSRGDVDAQLLGDHDLDSLLAAFSELEGLPARGPAAGKWRATQLLRLRALLRQSPEAAPDVARAFAERAGGDPRELSILAQSLAEAGTPESRDALLDLAVAELPAGARERVVLALGRLDEPTAETAGAIARSLDDRELGSVPALALGSAAGKLAGSDAEAAGGAVDELLTRYAEASSYDERRLYLQALANSGDPRAMEALRAALVGGDPRLAEVAAFGLRFMPGPDADTLLAGLLAGPGLTRVRVEAVRAIGFRDLQVWRPLLERARDREEVDAVRQAIERLLSA